MKFVGVLSILFTRRAQELLQKVQSTRFSDSELSRFIVEVTLAELDIRGFYFGRLKENGVIDILVLDREDRNDMEQLTSYPISVDLPMNRSILRHEVTWMDYRNDPFADYPDLQGMEPGFNIKTLVMAPITKYGVPTGGWGFTSKVVIEPSPEWDEFFKLISEIIATKFIVGAMKSNTEATAVWDVSASHELDSREQAVLEHMSDGKTNGEIAEILGYSESTIRMATIEIYRKLGVNSRQEAREQYLASKKPTS